MARSVLIARRRRRVLARCAPHVVLVGFVVLTLLPYGWAVLQAFKPLSAAQVAAVSPRHAAGPSGSWTLDNFALAWNFSYPPFSFAPDYLHSVIVAASVTLATLVTSTLAGFVLARYRFRGREITFTLLIVTFMVPFSVVLIPLYITVVTLGLDNSLVALIVTGLWSPLGILLMRQFIESIPAEVLEAGRIDGAAEWRLIVRMVVPLSTSALGVLAVYTFMHSWDDFLWPETVLHAAARWTLPLLATYFGNNAFPTPFVMAVALLTVLPVLVIYVFVARFFITGIGSLALHV